MYGLMMKKALVLKKKKSLANDPERRIDLAKEPHTPRC